MLLLEALHGAVMKLKKHNVLRITTETISEVTEVMGVQRVWGLELIGYIDSLGRSRGKESTMNLYTNQHIEGACEGMKEKLHTVEHQLKQVEKKMTR